MVHVTLGVILSFYFVFRPWHRVWAWACPPISWGRNLLPLFVVFLFINTIVTYLKKRNNNNKSEKSIKSPFAGTISGEVRSMVSANFLKNRGRNGFSKLGIGRSTNVSFFRWLKCLGIFRNGSACVFVYLIFFYFLVLELQTFEK